MKYNEKEFKSVSAEDLGLETDEEKKEKEKETEENKDAAGLRKGCRWTASSRRFASPICSKSHPVCLVPDSGLMSLEMEKYLEPCGSRRREGMKTEQNAWSSMPSILRLIPPCRRPLDDSDKDKAKKYAQLLYSQALLIADLPLEDPSAYTDLVCSLML